MAHRYSDLLDLALEDLEMQLGGRRRVTRSKEVDQVTVVSMPKLQHLICRLCHEYLELKLKTREYLMGKTG